MIMKPRSESEFQSRKTLVESMQYLFETGISSDVCIEVGPPDGETVKFRAHKCILMSRSEVFEAMFSSGMTECSNGAEAKVRVEDMDSDIFKQILEFVYCETTSISPETAGCLLYAAKKYMLHELVAECCHCLVVNLNFDNVIEFLDHSLHLDEAHIQKACLKLISSNLKTFLTGARTLSASRLVMEAILEVDTVPISELVVYECAVNWAKHQLKNDKPSDLEIRDALGDLLYKIRFPVMKATEFAEISAESDVLTAEEKVSIFCFIATAKVHHLKFPTGRRVGEEVWIDRASGCQSHLHCLKPCFDASAFTSNKDVLLTGIGFFAGFKRGYDIDMDILLSDNSLLKKSFRVSDFGKPIVSKMSLDEPIVIPSGVICTVKIFAHDAIGYCDSDCPESCTKDAVTFRFFKQLVSEFTTVEHGLIPRLYFRVL